MTKWIWPVSVTAVVAIAALLMYLGVLPVPFQKDSDPGAAEVIESITRTEEVALVSLGIQGIATEKTDGTIFGVPIPGGSRAVFLQYNYNAKLGFDSRKVKIEKIDEETIRVSIPEFVFLGYDDPTFKTIVEEKGVLSFTAPKIDTAKVISKILDAEAKQEHITANEELLQTQAKAFYASIITAVSPEIKVQFEFSGGSQ